MDVNLTSEYNFSSPSYNLYIYIYIYIYVLVINTYYLNKYFKFRYLYRMN